MPNIPNFTPIVSLTTVAVKSAGGAFRKFKKSRVPRKLKKKRKAKARKFYEQAGWPKKRIDEHLKGIDFTKPVEVVKLPKGTKVVQYQKPGRPVGNYFAPPGTPATKLGISPAGKSPKTYTSTQEVTVLRSTASSPVDTWSEPGKSFQTEGGGTQFFTPDNGLFE